MTQHLYGIHDSGGEFLFQENNVTGWTIYAEKIGDDISDRGGKIFNTSSTAICRLSFGWYGEGNIPESSRYERFAQRCANFAESSRYERFAQRCANFVASSQNCKRWIIGNEMNLKAERPLLPDGKDQPITPKMYAQCFVMVRDAIKAVQPDAQVIIGGVAPWNNETQYTTNESGDWVKYYAHTLLQIGAENIDGIALHAYTHGNDQGLIYNEDKMGAPFQNRHYNFKCYQDFLNETPEAFKHLPVYITEFDGDTGLWGNDTGLIKAAYGDINYWNQQAGNQPIQCLALYRWGAFDKWQLSDKGGAIQDLRNAMQAKHESPATLPKKSVGTAIGNVIAVAAESKFNVGDTVKTTDIVNLRIAPGTHTIVIRQLSAGTELQVVGNPQRQGDYVWINVKDNHANSPSDVIGWIVQDYAEKVDLSIKKLGLFRPCASAFPVTQNFGENPEYYSKIVGYPVPLRGHNGTDYAVPVGTQIFAADDGYIFSIAMETNGFGLHTKIQHSWGASLYAHLDMMLAVKDQPVKKGQPIALSGNSGAGSGPHLHFGIKIYPSDASDGWGGYTDPAPHITGGI